MVDELQQGLEILKGIALVVAGVAYFMLLCLL